MIFKKMKKIFLLLLLSAVPGINRVYSQTLYQINTKASSITVTGTSTLHDWDMKSSDVTGKMTASVELKEVNLISDVLVTCSAKNLLTDSKMMNEKAHDALKANTYPQIKFVYVSVAALSNKNGIFSGTITGNLTIAGKTNKVTIPFLGSVSSSGSIQVTGSYGLKMSQYGMETPTAMLGTLTTGDYVVLKYDLNFTK